MTINVLFLCTGNSARSILAEALLNHLGNGRFRAFSAGSSPVGRVNPGALDILQRKGLETNGYRSKSWDEFTGADAPAMDLIFTVCDSAAQEVCPVWVGHPVTVHWGIPDPAAATGEDEVRRAFEAAWDTLAFRLRALVSLPLEKMSEEQIKTELHAVADQKNH